MTSAENFFKQSITPTHSSGGKAPAEEVLQLLQSCAPYNLDELSKLEAHLPPEDSEGWLDISAQELEHLLEGREGSGVGLGGSEPSLTNHTQGGRSEKGEEEGSYSLVAVTQGMKNFINAMSSHEGAELPWSHSNELFRFDPESMAGALDRLLGAKDEELDSDDLDDDDDDDDDDDRVKGPTGPLGVGPEALENLRKYMDEMDHELMGTNIGQSFNQQASPSCGYLLLLVAVCKFCKELFERGCRS
ncbi:unnamed protein product [Oncorhynchus mykiss]|uniref:Uncharacterized protein n=1 Tax=Oncorhynchus mykiss TaxID=8022 RepID=A0A060XG38_ONCMY|nr:unnamed protein product [Oncorhynchus mykiss]